MSIEHTEEDAVHAAAYLKKLKRLRVPHSDAINMTNSYMGSRVMARGWYTPVQELQHAPHKMLPFKREPLPPRDDDPGF